MLLNNIKDLSKNISVLRKSLRYSSLFINGLKATDNYVFLIPHIDFLQRISDKEHLQDMLSKRQSSFDLNRLENLWNVYQELKNNKIECEKKRDILSKQLGELYKTQQDSKEIEKLKVNISLLKENLKILKSPLWSAEEAAIVECLKLPNILHDLTPTHKSETIYQYKKPQIHNSNHIEIGEQLDLIKYMSNYNYYIKGDAAIFELGAQFYFSKVLKEHNFIQFSNTDFVKSLVVEGCGLDPINPDESFILHNNEDCGSNDMRLHLTGGASLSSFFAYHSKNVILKQVMPLKYFSIGRQFLPTVEAQSLHNVAQRTCVNVFEAATDEDQLNLMLSETIELVKEIYHKLDIHFRLSYIVSNKLNMWESLRLAIEMYSVLLQDYVEVGYISVSGDFISKRLLFTYMENKEQKFPRIISGTILNVPKLLACVLEQDKEFVIPKQFMVDNWKL